MASLKPRVIVALDVSAPARARELVEVLGDSCDFYKVGSELFTSGGPGVVEDLVTTGKHVFLDLKLHDIPHTVMSAARSAAGLGVSLLTVHASGGRAMIEGAVEGAAGRAGVLAVTVLTSLDAPALAEAWGRDVPAVADEVVRLAGLAHSAGAQGIVCGGSEARRVRAEFGGALEVLVPGVRPEDADAQDQRRVVTPRAAADAGASYVVVGRPVTRAAEPRAALRRIQETLA